MRRLLAAGGLPVLLLAVALLAWSVPGGASAPGDTVPSVPPTSVATDVPPIASAPDLVSSGDTGSTVTGVGTTGTTSGPIITIDDPEAAPGERVMVSLDGFDSLWATITVCGNEARRGSADCNLAASVTNEFAADGSPMALAYVVAEPPVDCPCVLRAVGRDSREVAVTPIDITGHPVGPLVDAPVVGALVELTITAERRSTGAVDALRAGLGGAAGYAVTLTVRNVSTASLRDVGIAADVVRGDELLETLPFDDPGTLGVGQTWTETIDVSVPAPSFGTVTWRVVASGAGPTVETSLETTHRPWLLIVLVLLVVANVSLVLIRWRIRRRIERVELVSADDSPSGRRLASGEPQPVGAGDRS